MRPNYATVLVVGFVLVVCSCKPVEDHGRSTWVRPTPTPVAHSAPHHTSSSAAKSRVDQRSLWEHAVVNKSSVLRADKAIQLFQRNQRRYEVISKMRSNGAPWFMIACLHYRESDNDFRAMAHDGEPLTHRTREEPRGRLPHPDPPYTFEQSAEDAYYVIDRLQDTDWHDVQSSLDRTERFNGYGYRGRGLNSPYNWSGTNQYSRGKFVADHRFDPTAVDKQLGVAAILKRMQEQGLKVF